MTQTMLPQQTQQAEPQYEITDADKKRQQIIAAAWKAYHGELDPPLQKMPDEPDDNVMTNRCKPVVRRGMSFLFGDELGINLEKTAPKEDQDFLDKTWGEKEARIPLLLELDMNGAMAGCAFLRIVPDEDGTFRLITVNPGTVFMKTAPQDCETILLWCIQYSTTEKIDGKDQQVFYREEIAAVLPEASYGGFIQTTKPTSWSIQHWTKVSEKGAWKAEGAPIDWPYPFPPIFKCKNLANPNDPWGEPDVTPDLIGLNNALNLVQSNTNRVNKFYGQPWPWATGVGESTLDIKPGKVTVLPPGPDSKLDAVKFNSDITGAIAFADDLRSDGDEQSSVPGVAGGRIKAMPRGQLSGIAIELLFMPLLTKTKEKRCLYGKLIIDVSSALLVLNKMMKSMGDIKITLAWQNPLPHDDLPAIQGAVLLKQVGISNTTIQRDLGYDPEEELKLSQAEHEQQLERQQQMMIAQGIQPGMPGQQQQQPASPFMSREQ